MGKWLLERGGKWGGAVVELYWGEKGRVVGSWRNEVGFGRRWKRLEYEYIEEPGLAPKGSRTPTLD